MRVQDLMTRDPGVVVPQDSVVDAAKFMKQHNVGAMPVVDDRKNRKLVGIVTDRDICMNVVAEGRDCQSEKVQKAMSSNPQCVRPDDDINRAMEVMSKNQIRRLPVVDGSGKVVGMLATADIAVKDRERPEMEHFEETMEKISEPAHPA